LRFSRKRRAKFLEFLYLQKYGYFQFLLILPNSGKRGEISTQGVFGDRDFLNPGSGQGIKSEKTEVNYGFLKKVYFGII
jgi:hypothetical protein